MPTLRSQAHLQVAPAIAMTKTCKRACLPQRTADRKDAAKMKDRISKDKNGQLVTCGIFYCRVSAEFNGSGSLQISSWFDSDVLRNRQQKHTAIRYAAPEEDTTT